MTDQDIKLECLRIAVGSRDHTPGKSIVDAARELYEFITNAAKPQAGE